MFGNMRERIAHMWRTGKAEFFWASISALAIGVVAGTAAVLSGGTFALPALIGAFGGGFMHHFTGTALTTVVTHIFASSALRGIFSRHHTKNTPLHERALHPDEACADDLRDNPPQAEVSVSAPAQSGEHKSDIKNTIVTNEKNDTPASQPSLLEEKAVTPVKEAVGWKAQLERMPASNHVAAAQERQPELVGASR